MILVKLQLCLVKKTLQIYDSPKVVSRAQHVKCEVRLLGLGVGGDELDGIAAGQNLLSCIVRNF